MTKKSHQNSLGKAVAWESDFLVVHKHIMSDTTFSQCPYCHCNALNTAIYKCKRCGTIFCAVCSSDNNFCSRCFSNGIKILGVKLGYINKHNSVSIHSKSVPNASQYATPAIKKYVSSKNTTVIPNANQYKTKKHTRLAPNTNKPAPSQRRLARNQDSIQRIKKSASQRKMPPPPKPPQQRTQQKKGPCFIATAVYGSYDSPQVLFLRDFRDSYLLTNSIGRWFVNNYYRYSPAFADALYNKPITKRLIKIILFHFVWLARLALKFK
jgi:hypothetical protein